LPAGLPLAEAAADAEALALGAALALAAADAVSVATALAVVVVAGVGGGATTVGVGAGVSPEPKSLSRNITTTPATTTMARNSATNPPLPPFFAGASEARAAGASDVRLASGVSRAVRGGGSDAPFFGAGDISATMARAFAASPPQARSEFAGWFIGNLDMAAAPMDAIGPMAASIGLADDQGIKLLLFYAASRALVEQMGGTG